jgi:predicted RNase H-like HicB family nuclease
MARKAFTYTIVYEHDPETGSICASFPALDLATFGRDLEETRLRAREALELHLEEMLEECIDIPMDAEKIEQVTVDMATSAREQSNPRGSG